MSLLTLRDDLPDGILDCAARDLHRLLPGPTLIHLRGRRTRPLFVSVLLHGNEVTGLTAIQQVLRAHGPGDLPRSLILMIGNVSAAARGLRRLDGQPDYNRVWPGTLADPDAPEVKAMARAHAHVLKAGAVCAIDLHNNTGRNPHYGVISSTDPKSLHLASMFSPTVVWFRGLAGAQCSAFAGHMPSMTAECGQPGLPENAAAAARFIEAVLALPDRPEAAETAPGIALYHTLAVVRLPAEVTASFDGAPADLRLAPDLDRLNFTDAPAGTVWGETRLVAPLSVLDEEGRDVADRFFRTEDGRLRQVRRATPAMITVDEHVVRQDCLGYLMERIVLERN